MALCVRLHVGMHDAFLHCQLYDQNPLSWVNASIAPASLSPAVTVDAYPSVRLHTYELAFAVATLSQRVRKSSVLIRVS